MNFIDLIIIACIISGAILGFKKGIIKTIVQLVGSILVLILSYSMKDILASWLMEHLPFFNFAGAFEGISSLNIIIYQIISFVIIFIILYCILGIIVNISGMFEKVLKMTFVFALPSKILGSIVGIIEGIVVAFITTFIFYSISLTHQYVQDSKLGIPLLESTPIIGSFTINTTKSLEDINALLKEYDKSENKKEVNSQVLSTLIHYNLISKEDANELIKDEKIDLKNVTFN